MKKSISYSLIFQIKVVMLLSKYSAECTLNEHLTEKILFYTYWLAFLHLEKVQFNKHYTWNDIKLTIKVSISYKNNHFSITFIYMFNTISFIVISDRVFKKSILFLILDINECETLLNPCSGHGRCVNSRGNYSCSCYKGWEGGRCEKGRLIVDIH